MGGGVDLPTLMSYFEDAIREFSDPRTGSNTRYEMRDAALAAFSVFFTQSPSFQPTVASVTPVAYRLMPTTGAPVGSLSPAAATSG